MGWQLWRRRRRVVIYGKHGCHLCDDAMTTLEKLARRYPLSIEQIDITDDPTLFRKYDIRVPVIVIDGSVELEGVVSEASLRQALMG